MKSRSLVFDSLRFYWRTHLGVLVGCAISAAVLIGALFVGDSVHKSLESIALARLGRIDVALDAQKRSFGDDLAQRLQQRLGGEFAAAMRIDAMAIHQPDEGDRQQINQVDVVGVDSTFLSFSSGVVPATPAADEVLINRKLAAALGVDVGDEISLRMEKPGLLSRDAPLASRGDRETQRSLCRVAAVLSDEQFGRFSLRTDQSGPYNAFVPLDWLQQKLELGARANLIIAAGADADAAQAALGEVLRLNDAQLVLEAIEPHGIIQLESSRIYLDPGVADAARAAAGGEDESAEAPGPVAALSYLVSSIRSADGSSTPYSFMTALARQADPLLGAVPVDMTDDEILVSRWLADELGLEIGATVTVEYSELAAAGDFVDRQRDFRVRGILEMADLAAERDLVPDFPGLTDVDACADWDIGLTTDEEKLDDPANEQYWEDYRTTPKALITLNAGRDLWANAYGDLMAMRYRGDRVSTDELADRIRQRLEPDRIGLRFEPVRQSALTAASESMDLGQLFLGMSFFLIVASLILTAMLFVFSVEQRAHEMGVLLAVGHTPAFVRRLFLGEATLVALAGSLVGIPAGWMFARFLIDGLTSTWSGAVAGTAINFHAAPDSIVIGVVAATLISLAAMTFAMWRQARRPVRQLVADDFTQVLESSASPAAGARRGRVRTVVAISAPAGALALSLWALTADTPNPAPSFFGAGALMLIGGIALLRLSLARMSNASRTLQAVSTLGRRNTARRPGRSMAAAGILACGVFLVLAVSAMKEDLDRQVGERQSGTGGFELFAESSIAVHEELDEQEGRDAYRLRDQDAMDGVAFVQVKVRDGDDASCLNLNLAPNPPLLGVDPSELAGLGAFVPSDSDLWQRLDADLPDRVIPALVADSATATWKLKLKVGPESGSEIEYVDERGEPFRVKLVGTLPQRLTVLQGRLLIATRHFTELYPSESGYRMFLIDAPAANLTTVQQYLNRRLDRVGLDVVPSVDRLREFYAVEATYLMMFVVLGGLGLLLGTAGMGVLVVRNVLERRHELALLRAVGYSAGQATGVVLAEHRFLLGAGLGIGTISAAIAIIPGVMQPGVDVPYGLLAAFVIGAAVLSLAWIRLAAYLALRSPLVPALRKE